jgi:hypothetical protein
VPAPALQPPFGRCAEQARCLPPNVLAAFYCWCLEHRRGGMRERRASSYAYAISALLRQLLLDERLPASVSLEKLRLGLSEALARGDYLRRRVDPLWTHSLPGWWRRSRFRQPTALATPRGWRRSALAHGSFDMLAAAGAGLAVLGQ